MNRSPAPCKTRVAIALLFAAVSFAFQAAGQEKESSFNFSVFNAYNTLPVNKEAVAKTRNIIGIAFRGWAITTDKLSGTFTDIYGKPVMLDGSDNKEKAAFCIAGRLSNTGIDKAEWRVVSEIPAPKADYVNYTQVINGHSVVFSKLSFRFTKAGALTRVQMKNYGSPKEGIQPLIAKENALNTALRGLDDIIVADSRIIDDWSWFPMPAADGYKLHPAWEFVIKGRIPGGMPVQLTGYVDALTGGLLYRNNEVKSSGLDLTVKGSVYKNGITEPATIEPLADLNLHTGAMSSYTDADGNYSNPSIMLPLSIDVPLTGRWCHVTDSVTGLTPEFTTLASGSSVYTYPVTAPASSRHINAYYHATRIHNFMKSYFPAFTGLDAPFQTNVDVGSGLCNAFFASSSINFFTAGGGCNSFAEINDVVYHEYGHAINNSFYNYISGSPMMNSSLHEGFADIWAFSITHDPVLGKGAFTSGGFIRRYDQVPQVYPIDVNTSMWGDPHKVGQIIAGAWWDAGVALCSADTMTRLFTDVFYDSPDGPAGTEGEIFQSILVGALIADDDNADLTDGTPHYSQIIGAFAKHGIYIVGDVNLTHTEITDQPANMPIQVNASLYMSNVSFFHDLTLYYRVNNDGPWFPLTLTNSSYNFSGIIPAQPAGSVVEYYFTIHDMRNAPNAYLPITCNHTMPANQTTIPYQFGIGLFARDSTDFETMAQYYSIALCPGDDAVYGLWLQCMPTGALHIDHTTGTDLGMCLESKSTGMGMRGTSSVITPAFDISGYSNPVVSYYRWFSNESGNFNFKNDPWIVKIRDASGGPWQTIETTYQGDDNWRRRIFPVRAYLPASATHIQLRFFASDSMRYDYLMNGQSDILAAIDDIFVYDKGVPAAIASSSMGRSAIYPNPADDRISIALATRNVPTTISVSDMNGQKMLEVTVPSHENHYALDTRHLADGYYNIFIATGTHVEMQKIAVLHH